MKARDVVDLGARGKVQGLPTWRLRRKVRRARRRGRQAVDPVARAAAEELRHRAMVLP